MNFEEDKKINPNNLYFECLRQPQLFYDYGKERAEARSRMRLARRKRRIEKAQLDKAIRTNPENFNIKGKPAEGQIKAIIELDKKYKKITKEYYKTEEKLELCDIAVDEIGYQRKMALEEMIKLKIREMDSEIKQTTNGKEITENETKKKIRNKLKRKNDYN